MRSEIAAKKINKTKNKNINDVNLLKMMGTFHNQKKTPSKKWLMDPLTPSSIVVATLNPSAATINMIDSDAPKIYRGSIHQITNVWNKAVLKNKVSKSLTQANPSPYNVAWKNIMLAQQAYDLRDFHLAYHHLQLAISLWDGHPEQKVAQFFFCVYQFIHDTHKHIRAQLLLELTELKDQLPPYLREHCKLFIARLEYIKFGKTNISEQDFESSSFKSLLRRELATPHLLLHKTITPLMNPRLDILDILYPHYVA
jgi:hypothetical protein